MGMIEKRKMHWLRRLGCLLALLTLAGCGSREAKLIAEKISDADQPDKILFERSLFEIARSRYDVGRLTLNTLINTYPDSEYLAKAKLAIADSYYKEGGTAGLTQAQVEYRDFITFFPTAPEAPEAQYKIGLSHFRRISKPGRDLSEAAMAEAEFKEFLLRYPDSELIRKVKSKLRLVQELIADANFRIAKFYSQKRANKAVISRLEEIADDYPSYSRADSALWLLAITLEKVKKSAESVPYYSRIITDYPLSPLVEESKERLQALGQVVPRPTRASVIRAEADALHKSRRSLLGRFGGMMSGKPNLSATRRGPVRVTRVDVPTGPLVARAQPSQNGEKENEKGEEVGEGVGELKLELKSVTADGSSDGSVVEGETTAPSGNTVGVRVISDSASAGKEEKEEKDEDEEEKEEEDTSGGGNGDR